MIAVFAVNKLLYFIAEPENKVITSIYLLICVGVGAAAYGALAYRLGLAQKLLGDRITKIASKIGLK